MPRVTIITATYNRAEKLSRAIDSVLDQSFRDFEHIIVDDGSTDNTEEIVSTYQDQRLKYIYQKNQGANAARNRGLQEASGEYISFLDSDDEYTYDRIEKMVSIFDSLNEDYGGIFHGFEVYEDGNLKTTNQKESRDITFDDLSSGNKIGGFLSPMFRSEIFNKVGNLDESMESSQDYEFYLRAAKEYDFRGVDELLGRYHLTSDSISTDIEQKRMGQKKILDKYGDELRPRRVAYQHYSQGKILAEHGRMDEARQEFNNAIKNWPRDPLYYYYWLASLFGQRGHQSADRFKQFVKRLSHSWKNTFN